MQLSKLPILLLFLVFGITISAQNRYLEPVFDQVSVSPLTPYGFNYTFLPILFGGHFTKQPLVMQVYSPVGDIETDRPLVLYLHTGNFFPFPGNNACGGALNDSTNVEFATQLAKMGYVVAVVDYRVGWNPFSTSELTRRFTLINGAYRGLQDIRSCIRYFRKDVAEGGNNYGIDPNKIVVWGQGTGGYLSLAMAYLDKFSEIYTTADPNKFRIPLPNGAFYPMVQESYNGDINGEQAAIGVVDATYNSIFSAFPIGDTMYIPNTPGYSSEFNLAVNMGGALGDSSWMDAGDLPLISYHVPTDFLAPCFTDILNVQTPTGIHPVVEVSGSCEMQTIANGLGLNNIFNNIPAGHDPYGVHSISSFNGFYPFIGTPTPPGATSPTSAPWAWTSYSGVPAPTATGCEVDAAVARAYIDTIIGYYAPRACVALNLGCNFVNTKELSELEVGLKVSPVPATDVVSFISEKEKMTDIYVYDLNGRLVKAHTSIQANGFQMQRNALVSGMYIAEVRFEKGFIKRKIVFAN